MKKILGVFLFLIIFGTITVWGQSICDTSQCENPKIICSAVASGQICPSNMKVCDRDCLTGACCQLPAKCGDDYAIGICDQDPDYFKNQNDQYRQCLVNQGIGCCKMGFPRPFPSPDPKAFCPPGTTYISCDIFNSNRCYCTVSALIKCKFDCTNPPPWPFYLNCRPNSPTPPCECPTGYCDQSGDCLGKYCQKDPECPNGLLCLNNYCQPPPRLPNDLCPVGKANCCNEQKDCPPGTMCVSDGHCEKAPPIPRCSTSADCFGGPCLNGQCQPPGTTTPSVPPNIIPLLVIGVLIVLGIGWWLVSNHRNR